MSLEIVLEEMRFYAHHGVLEQERLVGNNFTINLTIGLNTYSSLYSDDLKDTINYAEVYKVVQSEMNSPSALLEHVVGRIVCKVFEHWSLIGWIDINLSKLNPPFTADLKGAMVRLRIDRSEYTKLFSVSL
jgi:dihydroneopterin aldolase